MSKKKKTIDELLEEALVPEEEQPYTIPEGWIWVRFGCLIKESKLGLVRSSKEQAIDKQFPYLKMNNITIDGRLDLSNLVRVDLKKEELYQNELKDGDFLFNTRNSVELVGKSTIFSDENTDEPVLFNNNILRVRFLRNVNSYLVNYYLNSPYGKSSLNNIKSGTTNVSAIYAKNLNTISIPLPPLNEQKSIVEKVEQLFKRIEEVKQLIVEAKETFEFRRAAILNKAFCGELTKKWRKENSLDFNWEEKRLEDLIEYGPQNGLYKPQKAYGTGVLIVRIDNFYDGKINDWQTLKRLQLDTREMEIYGLKNNDLIINRVNSIEYLGKSALVRNLIEPCVFESNVMRIGLNGEVIPEYLIKYLNSSRGLQELRKNAKHAVNQASINQQDVKNVLVPLPSKEEQEEIERILNVLFETEQNAMSHFNVLEKLEILKKSILSKAFRGELGTNDPSEESAIELLKEVLQEQVK
ncbi:restriction endonuclease subunit S [Priestia aryabhattai]|uniref:restriction endonuclease subunit S n=1 Tax=Priestia aryabhattai TaxID=412384 RepID=UPI0030D05F33